MENRLNPTGADIAAYFTEQANKTLLRFITCGSVDDGKSTLIGRLLHDSKQVFEDQLAVLEKDSTVHGTQGEKIDFALLVDGLASEREQGITIDVAYRFFASNNRKFIVADTPGHEQYTRNMATGASNADLAILLVDARKGLLSQTRRHALICSIIGIPNLVLCVNKMDLVDYDEAIFDAIKSNFEDFVSTLDPFCSIQAIPVSALAGVGITEQSEDMPWFVGPSLLAYLESVVVTGEIEDSPLRLPVQWVNRPSSDIRGFCGQIASGTLRKGQNIRVSPTGKTSTVKKIFVGLDEVEQCPPGQSVMVALTDEIDISRGSVICDAKDAAQAADQFEATILWMDEAPMLQGRPYILKRAGEQVQMQVTRIKHKVDINTGAKLAATTLDMNEIGVCNIACTHLIPFDPYLKNKTTGSFILIDRLTNATVAMGMLHFSLHRADNVHRQHTQIDREARSAIKAHQPAVLWFTGLSGSGKSTIADKLEQKLYERGIHTMMLDGDNIRQGLNKDLGFSDGERVENIRRIAQVSKLTYDAGLLTLTSFISPFRSERRLARQIIDGDGPQQSFFEVFIDVPLDVAEERDVKGLYAKARKGEIMNFTGISSPYEPPQNPEVVIKSDEITPEEAAEIIITMLVESGHLPADV